MNNIAIIKQVYSYIEKWILSKNTFFNYKNLLTFIKTFQSAECLPIELIKSRCDIYNKFLLELKTENNIFLEDITAIIRYFNTL